MKHVLIISILIFAGACRKPAGSGALFEKDPVVNQLQPVLQEVSGICDSKLHAGMLWAQEDSGNPTRIHMVSHSGQVGRSVYLKGVMNRDWEDMALFESDIFLADIGDNNEVFSEYSFYKFPEPAAGVDTMNVIDQIRFRYPDGSHNAEAFVVDPVTRNIFIFTKQDLPSRIYKLSFPYSTTTVQTVSYEGTVSFTGIVGAGISPDGDEVIIKTYGQLHYYARQSNETITQALQKNAVNLPYESEPQGEAIGFAQDDSGFFTLSETGNTFTTSLRFYRRK